MTLGNKLALHEMIAMLDLSLLPDLPALQQLARALWHNGSVRGAALMIGAGFSKNAILQVPDTQEAPNWNELLDELVHQLYPIDQSAAPKDALRIAEEFRIYFGQATLDGFIRTRFPDRAWLPGPLHLQALNFPWSDILTTNWDTLLERTADEVTDFIYEVVRTEADIAHARSPRIIKLHGTLGDKEPLVLASEDYRTYPVRHAAFVNLARQIFIENDLCLLGFSGNDPNFLEWVGWVRDQLGGHARRIYLAGYLELSASARRYLEAHNIAPIDLAPLVGSLPRKERYGASTKLLLDALRIEKPPAPHEWKQHAFNEFPRAKGGPDFYEKVRKDDAFAAGVLKETARLLRDDRENYPGWMVCPRQDRRGPKSGYDEFAIFKVSVLARIKPSERGEILNEFLWRYTISFCDLPLMFRDALVSVMEEMGSPIEREFRLKFAVALMRDARIEANDANFEKWSAVINAEASLDAPEWFDAQYQRCLRMRDQLDLAGLAKALGGLNSENPLWRLRQAGLHAEVGEYEKAIRLIKDVTADFEKAYRLDRNSLWIKSCLAWASWLNRVVAMGNFHRWDDLPRAREFRNLKIDPSSELEALENAADALRRKEQEDDAAAIPLFDAGSYKRGRPKTLAQPGDTGFEYLHELDQLIECTGIPMRINHVQVASGAATSIMRVTYHHSIRWYIWLVRSLHSHFDSPFVRYFGRIAIAQLPQDVADQLRKKLDLAIVFWRTKFTQSVGEEHKKDRSIALDELRLVLSIQSHVTVRMTVDEAVRAFGVASQIAQDPAISHHWIVEAAGELAKYALEAMPPEQQASVVLDVMKFPLAAERGGPIPGWPDLVRVIARIKPERNQQEPRWDQRIGELLAAAAPNAAGRAEATDRLAYLASHDVLKSSERDIFADVLWGKVDDGSPPLPADTQLLTSSFAKLPAPAELDPVDRVKVRILTRDLKDVMDCAGPLDTRILSEKQNHLIALYNTAPLGVSIPAQRATELFDQIMHWKPTMPINDDPMGGGFKQNFNDFVGQQASEILTFVLVPAMTKEDRNEARLQALLNFINQMKLWRAVAALPNFIETVPTMQDNIERAIHRGLSATDHLRISGAASALIRWSLIVDSHAVAGIPRTLIEQLLSMVETRQEEGLHVLLHAVTALIKDQALTDQDMARLMHTLSELRDETKYSDISFDSRRAVSISLVRQQCVRLARTLKDKITDDGTLGGWCEDGHSDPLPEVRFATQAA